MLVQAESGVVAVTGTPDAPAKVGISIADIASGMYAYSSILAALYPRERHGRGERIDISMLECLTEWMTPALYVWQGTGAAPAARRRAAQHDRALRRVRLRRRRGDVRHADRSRVAALLRRRAGTTPRSPTMRGSRPMRSASANRDALEAIIEARFRRRHARRGHRAARRRRHPDRRDERRAGRRGASATRRARALDDGRLAGRRHPRARCRRTISRSARRAWDAFRRSASIRAKSSTSWASS